MTVQLRGFDDLPRSVKRAIQNLSMQDAEKLRRWFEESQEYAVHALINWIDYTHPRIGKRTE